MRFETFHFEIKDLLTQFCNAFDSVVIKRFNNDRETVSKINVRYLYSPKQRVLYDIVNKAQNIDLPAIAITIGGIARDDSRVFNKLDGFYENSVSKSYFYKTPVPVNIDINMSIIAKYQTDIDQILTNFIPYTNPYIIISWKVPADIQLPYMQEIRSEVMWNGGVSLSYPTEIGADTKYRVTADTSFTIKGWLFRNDNHPVSNIYTVSANFYSVSAIDIDEYTSAKRIESINKQLSAEKEVITVKALPDTAKVELVYGAEFVETTHISLNRIPVIVLRGGFLNDLSQMVYTQHVFLSTNHVNMLPVLSAIDFYSGTSVSSNNPPFSAYEIKTNGGEIVYTPDTIIVTLPPLSTACDFKIIVSNESGYKSYFTGVLQ